eukprot:SAG25_NODE_4448_length_813_cov_1.210084_2_plen_122_part_01
MNDRSAGRLSQSPGTGHQSGRQPHESIDPKAGSSAPRQPFGGGPAGPGPAAANAPPSTRAPPPALALPDAPSVLEAGSSFFSLGATCGTHARHPPAGAQAPAAGNSKERALGVWIFSGLREG